MSFTPINRRVCDYLVLLIGDPPNGGMLRFG